MRGSGDRKRRPVDRGLRTVACSLTWSRIHHGFGVMVRARGILYDGARECSWFSAFRLPLISFRRSEMSHDPFEQFERSRGGGLIPVAIFALGAGLTVFAIGILHDVRIREEVELQEMQEAIEAEPMMDPASARVGGQRESEESRPPAPVDGGDTTELRDQNREETTSS